MTRGPLTGKWSSFIISCEFMKAAAIHVCLADHAAVQASCVSSQREKDLSRVHLLLCFPARSSGLRSRIKIKLPPTPILASHIIRRSFSVATVSTARKTGLLLRNRQLPFLVASFAFVATMSTTASASAAANLTAEYGEAPLKKLPAGTEVLKASELWKDRPVVMHMVRRPGCILCRAEAQR